MASLTTMSYAEIVLAMVPDAPPTWKKQLATSCPAPISANVPYLVGSRLTLRALSRVAKTSRRITDANICQNKGQRQSQKNSGRTALESASNPQLRKGSSRFSSLNLNLNPPPLTRVLTAESPARAPVS